MAIPAQSRSTILSATARPVLAFTRPVAPAPVMQPDNQRIGRMAVKVARLESLSLPAVSVVEALLDELLAGYGH